MASPYNNGYLPESVPRAPSPYNQGHALDSNQRAPSPFTPSPYEQGQSNSYYDQHPQTNNPNFGHNGQVTTNRATKLLLTSYRQPQYNQAQPPYNGAPTAEGERGILGALGGGVIGVFIGKQTSHGFLGTVGGAIVGSLTEDWAKKRPSRPTTPNQKPPCPPPGQGYVDSATTVSTTTHVQPGYWQAPAPAYQNHSSKPCGHNHHCGCNFFGRQ